MDRFEDSLSTSHFPRALEDYRNELLTIYRLLALVAMDMNILPDRRYVNEAVSLDKLSSEAFCALLNKARHYSIFDDQPTSKRHRIRSFARRYLHPASSEVVQGKEQKRTLIASMRSNAHLLAKLRAKVRELNRTESATSFKRAFNEALKLTGMPHGVFPDQPEKTAAPPHHHKRMSAEKLIGTVLAGGPPLLTTPGIKKELERFGLTPEKMMPHAPIKAPGFLSTRAPPHLRAES